MPRPEGRGDLRVLGMLVDWEGESPFANLTVMEVKGSEAQGHPPTSRVFLFVSDRLLLTHFFRALQLIQENAVPV